MEDADFVADSEDELHSEEDLVARRVAAGTRVVPAGVNAIKHAEHINELRAGGVSHSDGPTNDVEMSVEQQQGEIQTDAGGSCEQREQIGGDASISSNDGAAQQQDKLLRSSPRSELTHVDAVTMQPSHGNDEIRPPGVDDDAHEDDAEPESADSRPRVFKVGDLIEVESRTWPGINKPGGSGRVVNVHQETNAQGEAEIFYDVRYVLGGFERRIESEYVELSHILQLERAQGRVRYERVFYHDEFADEMHKKKKPLYDPDAFANAEHSRPDAVGPQASKRKRNSTRRRSNDSDGTHQQQRRYKDSANTASERRPSAVADGMGSGSSESDDGHVIRRIGDSMFVMDSSANPTQSTQGDDPYTAVAHGTGLQRVDESTFQRDQAEADRRRRRRIIESEEESSESDSERRRPQQHQRPPQSLQKPHRHDSHPKQQQRARVRTSKKRRRYVGGYLHSGDDVDATFIQPEDNPNALPDDVAREIGFKLGKSKAELKAQLATSASSLTANLRAFNDQKDLIDLKIKRASALTSEELRDFHRQTIELEHFLTQRLIRGGEDVMNAVIVKLTRKGGSLPDSVELVFDDQKREISALGVWLRKVLSALETAFKVRGESLPSEDRHQQSRQRDRDDGEPVSSSSELDDRRYQSEDDDFYTNDFQYDGGDYYQSRDMGTTVKKPRRDSRRENIGSVVRSPKRAPKGYRSKKSQAVDTFMESFNKNQRGVTTAGTDNAKQARRKAKFATSLDDFEFIQYSSEQQRDLFLEDDPHFRLSTSRRAAGATREELQASNVRLPGKKRPMAPTDPRWDWLKQGRAKAQNQARAQSKKTPSLNGPASSSSSTLSNHHRASHKRKDQEKLIGHVQNALLQLREKRYEKLRYPSASSSSGGSSIRGVAPSFVPGYGYDPPPMTTRNESMAFSAQQQRPHYQQQKSRLGESSSFEDSGGHSGSAPAKSTVFKGSASAVAAPLSTQSLEPQAAAGPRIKWENVFDVLSGTVDDEELMSLGSERRAFLMTCGLLECTCGRHQTSYVGAHSALQLREEVLEDSRFEVAIKDIATRLRQDLSALRFQEFEFLRSLSGSSGRSAVSGSEPSSYTESPEWRALVDRADRCHASLSLLVRHAVQSVQDQLEMVTMAPSLLTEATRLVRAIVVEIARIIAQLPDCESLFSSCPSYVFYFEVADRNAKTTPLLTAITRTYWYSIQALLDLKQAAASGTGAQAIEAAIEGVLPTNRAILAASLFLVDLYLFLPSSYRLDHNQNEQEIQAEVLGHNAEASMPAISLWLLLYDCFASGKCSFQAGKRSASGDGRDFWAFLQTMYRDHFVDQLAIAFVQNRSSGGYLVDHLPTISKAPKDAEDVAEGQLLALQSIWDLCILFSVIFPTANSNERDDAISEARWAVVKDLLQPGMHAFLPFSGALTTQSRSQKDFTVYSSAFKLHVLQRVLLLSKLSAPQSDIVERLLEELWEDTSYSASRQETPSELVELSPFFADLLTAALSSPGNALSNFVNAHKWGAADHVDMVSGIILAQILKFEKAIHRNRFRQPICRAISARRDATKPTEDNAKPVGPLPPTTTVQVHVKATSAKPKAWNWGASGSTSALSRAATKAEVEAKAQPPASVKRGRDEERLMVSILLALAVSSIYQDAATTSTSSLGLRDPAQRANKSLKRDLEFYYKEMARIVNANAEFGVLLSQALYVMGRLAMELSNEYAAIFSYLNDHLLAFTQALRGQRTPPSDKDSSAIPLAAVNKQTRLLQRGVLTTLHLMRDLTQRLVAIIPSIPESPSSSYTMDAVRASLSFILNSGLEACLDAAVDDLISIDALNVALEIIQCVLPRAADEPVQCLQVAAVASATAAPDEPSGEFDEFDDPDMDDVWASVDLDSLAATTSVNNSPTAPTAKLSSLKSFEEPILQSILTHLRIGLQRAVIKYPQRGLVSYHELYAIELLGVMVSTCSFQFGWSLVSGSSMKPRVLAPRLFSAILKSHPEKEWFSTCFLSESGADQELANIWLMGTLDLQALFPSLCTLQANKSLENSAFPIPASETVASTTITTELAPTNQIRYSNYWVMLTDAMIYNVLRENPVAQYKMDPLLLQLMRSTASNCKFVQTLQSIKNASSSASLQPPSDLRTLYELHLDVFQEFCRGAGELWRKLAANPTLHRSDMNRFRLKMMDIQSGVFSTFPEAYEINLKMVCQDLDRSRHNWYDLSEKFLQDFASTESSSSSGGGHATATNYHSIDESLELAHHGQRRDDPSVRILIVLFKFMYGCVDTFLFHCGPMAIGQQNIFFSVMKLMFRQASCAEFPQAEKRLLRLQLALVASDNFDSHHQAKWFDTSDSQSITSTAKANGNRKSGQNEKQQAKSISPACLGFVESVRLFFARQKYPSLIHWFSQTLETYQTVKRGWSSSPLRKLLLNVLDPHGPLGIHSYYPIEVHQSASSVADGGGRQREFDVRQVRREAFYLSCGLFFCRCTASYEHSRSSSVAATASAARDEAEARLQTLRKFILNDFIQETFDYAAGDQVCLHETLVPVAQFLRAVLSHCNMNLPQQHHGNSEAQSEQQMPEFDFQAKEAYYCLESILLYCVKTFQAERVLQSSISCVLVLELCGIVEELVPLNDAAYDNEVSTLLELALAYFKEIFVALGKTSANALEPLFAQTGSMDATGTMINVPPPTSELLASFRPLAAHGIHGIKFELPTGSSTASGAFDEYGISRLRIRADLVISIGRLAERCRKSSDFRLRRFVE